jgi:WD repeat-containing protein 24
MTKDESNIAGNSNTANSKADSIATESSSETDRSGYEPFCIWEMHPSLIAVLKSPLTCSTCSYASTVGSSSNHAGPLRSQSYSLLNSSRYKASTVTMVHVLTVSATVTRLKWRPPAMETLLSGQGAADRHESMLAVATAPIKGVNAGGSGLVGLWTWNRPFMPLSVVDGHQVGAVQDFFWLDTPHPDSRMEALRPQTQATQDGRRGWKPTDENPRVRGMALHDIDTLSSVTDKADKEDRDGFQDRGICVWQHVLSVGRDGRCLIQSFARGKETHFVVPSTRTLVTMDPETNILHRNTLL